MFEQMSWDDTYSLWKDESIYFADDLNGSICPEPISIERKPDESIYGFDWLTKQ